MRPMEISGHTLKHDLFELAKRTRNFSGGIVVANVKNFGAVGSGAGNQSTAIQRAIDSLPIAGGVLYFPPGIFRCTAVLDFTEKVHVIIMGAGGRSPGAAPATIVRYSGANIARFFDCRTTSATDTTTVSLRDLCIQHTTAFTGNLVDLDGAAADTGYFSAENVMLLGAAANITATGFNLNKVISSVISNCETLYLNRGILGAADAASYSNAIEISGTTFVQTNNAIHNPGQAWVVRSCTFEGSSTSVASAMTHAAGVLCDGLLVEGCWSGDTTSGTQFAVAGNSINFKGNWIGCTGGTGINFDQATNGADIVGNTFVSCTNALKFTVAPTGLRLGRNAYTGVTNRIDATSAAFAIGTQQWDAAGDEFPRFYSRVLIPQPGSAAVLTMGDAGVGNKTGISFDADVNLYRDSANVLKTQDTFSAVGALTTDDNFIMNTAGRGIYVKEGANAKMGVATLVAGTVVVNTTAVSATSRIMLTHQTAGGVIGAVGVSARTAATSFTITSSSAADTSVIAWLILEPA